MKGRKDGRWSEATGGNGNWNEGLKRVGGPRSGGDTNAWRWLSKFRRETVCGRGEQWKGEKNVRHAGDR